MATLVLALVSKSLPNNTFSSPPRSTPPSIRDYDGAKEGAGGLIAFAPARGSVPLRALREGAGPLAGSEMRSPSPVAVVPGDRTQARWRDVAPSRQRAAT